MTLEEAMAARHSVRSYEDRALNDEDRGKMEDYLDSINSESGLSLRLVTDEPVAFSSMLAHYGSFSGVRNYITVSGGKGLSVRAGYYGEKAVLYAQTLGLRTCWVGLTYKKNRTMATAEKLYLVISIGYGLNDGKSHKSKLREDVASVNDVPGWFLKGVDAALLAPTAMNQQKFRFTLSGDKVTAKAGLGFYSKVDLGIAMLHFELGSGKKGCFSGQF